MTHTLHDLQARWPGVSLTDTETKLLLHLADAPGPVAESELLERVWGYAPGVRSQTVQVTVKRIRDKIEETPRRPTQLRTVRGHGYELSDDWPDKAVDLPVAYSLRRSTNIGVALDSFVGRAAERAALNAALDGAARCISLHGPGGVGKTRLAVHVARVRSAAHDGDVWFTDLSHCVGRTQVAEQMAAAAGDTRLPEGPDAFAEWQRHLAQSSSALWILDNAEQLDDDAVRGIRELLAHAPQVQFILTSRTLSGIAGERRIEVGPLPTEDAVTLLLDRSHQRAGADADAAERIVTAVDGLPLAIELAAARTRLMTLAELAGRLETSLDALGSGGRHRPERHRTLHNTVSWSWTLLNDGQQQALVHLATLPHAMSLHTAEALIGTSEAPLETLADLVDAALVMRLAGPHTRLRVLRPIRQVVHQLGADHHPTAHDAAAEWAHVLCTSVTTPLSQYDIERLAPELPNLLAVARQLAHSADPRLLAALRVLSHAAQWDPTTYADLAALTKQALAATTWSGEQRASLMHYAVRHLEDPQLELTVARTCHEALALVDADTPLAEDLRSTLVQSLGAQHRHDDALRISEQSLALNPHPTARVWFAHGAALFAAGRLVEAEAAFSRAAEQDMAEGHCITAAFALRNVALCASYNGESERALPVLQQATTLVSGLPVPTAQIAIAEYHQVALARVGRVEEAARIAHQLLETLDSLGRVPALHATLRACGAVLLSANHAEAGCAVMERALALSAPDLGHDGGNAAYDDVLRWVVVGRSLCGRIDEARDALTQLKARTTRCSDLPLLHAFVLLADGEVTQAKALADGVDVSLAEHEKLFSDLFERLADAG